MTDIPRKWERKLHAEPALCPAEEGGGIWLQGAEIDAFNVSVSQHHRGALGFFSWSTLLLQASRASLGSTYLGTASTLTWMAPGGTVGETQTQSHCAFTARKEGMEPLLQNLALPFLAILCASAGGVAENWDFHPKHFRDIQSENVERKCVNKGIIHAMQLPPCLQSQGAKHWPICGAHVRAEHHREKWEDSPEKGDLLLVLHRAGMGRWEGS